MDYIKWRVEQQDAVYLYHPAYEAMAKTADALAVKTLVNELWKGKNHFGLFLYGPDGCGKHTMAAYCIDSIADYSGDCRFLFLHGSELERDFADVGVLNEYLNQFLDDILEGKEYDWDEDTGKPVCTRSHGEMHDACIVLEAPLEYSHWKSLQLTLYKFLSMFSGNEEYSRLFLILISQEPVSLYSLMQREMRAIGVQIPGEERRRHFIETSCSYVFQCINKETFIQRTEGMTLAQIKNLAENVCRVGVMEANEDVARFLQSQARTPTAEECHMAYETKLTKFLGTLSAELTGALDKLAAAIREMPKGVVQAAGQTAEAMPALTQQEPELDEASVAQKRREELEAMPPNECMLSIFGKERVDRFLQNNA